LPTRAAEAMGSSGGQGGPLAHVATPVMSTYDDVLPLCNVQTQLVVGVAWGVIPPARFETVQLEGNTAAQNIQHIYHHEIFISVACFHNLEICPLVLFVT